MTSLSLPVQRQLELKLQSRVFFTIPTELYQVSSFSAFRVRGFLKEWYTFVKTKKSRCINAVLCFFQSAFHQHNLQMLPCASSATHLNFLEQEHFCSSSNSFSHTVL